MAFIYNGRIPENITYNGSNVSKIMYNNELVWAKKRLPNEYQEVEYIEAIDGQYINTNYIPTATNKVVCEYSINSWTSASTYQGIFGTRNTSGSSNDCFGYTFSSSTLYICYGKQVSKTFSNQLNHKYKAKLSIDDFELDGESLATSFTGTTNFTYPLLIFARNRNDGAGSFLNGKIYSFKIYDNDTLVKNYIPCYRKTDNKIGFYDIINTKNLFDKSSVVYIQSWIDTYGYWGVTADSSKSFRVPVEPNTTYTISASNSNETVFRAGWTNSENLPTDGNPILLNDWYRYSDTNTPITITTGNDAKYIVIQLSNANIETTKQTLQIEKGSSATTYEEFPFYTNAGTGAFIKGQDINVKRLPNEYQEVNYIDNENDGAYINTGVYGSFNIEVDFKFQNYKLYNHMIGSRNSFQSMYFIDSDISGSKYRIACGKSSISTEKVASIGEDIVFKTIKTNDTINAYINNELYGTYSNQVFQEEDIEMRLFGCKNSNSIAYGRGRIYYCKIKENGVLVRNFVPCYRKADNEIGMYDITNSGKNLLNSKLLEQGGILDATGVENPSTTRVRTPYVEVLPNTFYTISNSLYTIRMDLNDVAYIHCYDSNKNYLGVANNQTRYNEKAYTFKTLTNTKYMRAVFQKTNSSSEITVAEVKTANPMIEQNNTLTSYEPYPFYTNAGTGIFDKGEDI